MSSKYYKPITMRVDIEYAMNIKADLMRNSRLIIKQDRLGVSKGASFTTSHAKYEDEYISITPVNAHSNSGVSNRVASIPLMNQIKRASRKVVHEPMYELSFNMAAFDTMLGAIEKFPNQSIEREITNSLMDCAKNSPHMFFDKLIKRLPIEVQMDYLFIMDELMPDKKEELK
jgi:hypothetical protein